MNRGEIELKKKILMIAGIVVLLAIVLAGIYIFTAKDKSKQPNLGQGGAGTVGEEANQYMALNFATVSDLEEYVAKNKCTYDMPATKEGATIEGFPFGDYTATVTYAFDKQGKATQLSAWYMLNADIVEEELVVKSLTVEQFEEAVIKNLNLFCNVLEYELSADLYKSNADGTFTQIKQTEDYQSVMNGESGLDFSIRGRDGCFWILRIVADGDLYTAEIEKYYDVEKYLDYVANISLYEEKE